MQTADIYILKGTAGVNVGVINVKLLEYRIGIYTSITITIPSMQCNCLM